MDEKSFLGVGWGFPPTFDKENAEVIMVSKEEDIRQSLSLFFQTHIGERIMRSDFGCIIHNYQFDRTDENLLGRLSFEIKQGLRTFEPRIIVHSVNSNKSNILDGVISVHIDYEIHSNNVRDNIVFPFYINEGTEIS
jgi:hypothetical protein